METNWKDLQFEERMKRLDALRALSADLFIHNLIGTDFANIQAWRTEYDFAQDSAGITFSFTISNHALGKIDPDVEHHVLGTFGLIEVEEDSSS